MMLTIRRAATESDLDAVIALRTEAERWLQDRGIRQWTTDYADMARDVLQQAVEMGQTWVIEDGPFIVATVTVSAAPDPDFWSWIDDPDDALYLGKLIVSRAHEGEQIGDAVMNWASQTAATSGKRWVRLDCRRDNQGLHAYYLARGFTHLRTWHAPTRRTESGWLAQRTAGSLTPARLKITT